MASNDFLFRILFLQFQGQTQSSVSSFKSDDDDVFVRSVAAEETKGAKRKGRGKAPVPNQVAASSSPWAAVVAQWQSTLLVFRRAWV